MSDFRYPVIVTGIAAVLAVILPGDQIDSPLVTPPSSLRVNPILCGPIALTVLLRLEGEFISVEDVDRRLGGAVRKEHSLAELASISEILGHPLRGVHLGSPDIVPDRPFIAHLRSGSSGHFVVIRPIRASSRYIQIIDPIFGNRILRFEELIHRDDWSGCVLVQPPTVEMKREVTSRAVGGNL